MVEPPLAVSPPDLVRGEEVPEGRAAKGELEVVGGSSIEENLVPDFNGKLDNPVHC